MRERLTYANVVSTICLFILLGGGAYAAVKLPKNSVGAKQLKKSSVTAAKLKKNAVTGAKVKNGTLTGTDIDLSRLGKVPSAATAEGLSAPEGIHLVGSAGEPGFEGGAQNFGSFYGINTQAVGFYKDHEGIVHLVGYAKVGTSNEIFRLPAGFRPASGTLEIFEGRDIFVFGTGAEPPSDGRVIAASAAPGEGVSLSGVTFRAGS
jgi:hypothetical protein